MPYCDTVIFVSFSNFLHIHSFRPLYDVLVYVKCFSRFITSRFFFFFGGIGKAQSQQKFHYVKKCFLLLKHRERLGQNVTRRNQVGASQNTHKKRSIFALKLKLTAIY